VFVADVATLTSCGSPACCLFCRRDCARIFGRREGSIAPVRRTCYPWRSHSRRLCEHELSQIDVMVMEAKSHCAHFGVISLEADGCPRLQHAKPKPVLIFRQASTSWLPSPLRFYASRLQSLPISDELRRRRSTKLLVI